MFSTYLNLGVDHILDLNAYDHILFVVTLCVIYAAHAWKKVLILVTAFTIGHSVTLALATFNIVNISPTLIETLIPITIIITAIYNIIQLGNTKRNMLIHYFLAGFFGLIHGLGFSNYLKALLGKEESIWQPLLAFNLGVEAGQVVIVMITMAISYILISYLTIKEKFIIWAVSMAAIVISLKLIIEIYNG